MREKLRSRTLDILLFVALVVLISQRALREIPELFPGGAATGDILATLATGYLGAWFFNLMNIRLPARRAKKAVLSVQGNVIAQYAVQAQKILQAMAGSLQLPRVPQKPSAKILQTVLGKTDPNGSSNTVFLEGAISTSMTWLQYIGVTVRESRLQLDRLDNVYEHLEPETIAALSAVDSTSVVRINHNYPTFPPMNNRDMLWIESMYMDYWNTCYVLVERYTAEIYPLIPERNRLSLDAEEQIALDEWEDYFRREAGETSAVE